MKDADILKIRQFVKNWQKEIQEHLPETQREQIFCDIINIKLDSLLAFLPCETCNGTGKVPKHDGKPCSPGCQGHRTHPCEKCGRQWDGPMDCPNRQS
jgi:RecJ-like exonuclease